MSQKLIEELRRENLCTHFILPLCKMNKFSFMASNFVNCFISKSSLPSKTLVVVQVIDLLLVHKDILSAKAYHSCYRDSNSNYYLVFQVPAQWRIDITLFRTGRFSQMSSEAKETIIRYSGLPYKRTNKEGIIETDGRLLALERHPQLKAMWEEMLGPPIHLEDQDELLSLPDDRSYIDLEQLTLVFEKSLLL